MFQKLIFITLFFFITEAICENEDKEIFIVVPAKAGVKVCSEFGPWACTGIEDNSKEGKGARPFKVTCRDKKANTSVTCNFNGNPHPCSAYNKNPIKFYSQLLQQIGRYVENNKGVCGPQEIETKLCGSQATYEIQLK